MRFLVYVASAYLVLISSLTVALTVKAEKCKGVPGTVQTFSVDVSDCHNTSGCTLIKGNTHLLKTTFVPEMDIQDVNFNIYGVISGIKILYSSEMEVCKISKKVGGGSCSRDGGFKKGHAYVHESRFPVRQFFPEIGLKVRVQYSAPKRNKVLCYEIPVKIGSSTTRGRRN